MTGFVPASASIACAARLSAVRQTNAPQGELGWMTGFEPATSGATVRRSTTELHPPFSGTPKFSIGQKPWASADRLHDRSARSYGWSELAVEFVTERIPLLIQRDPHPRASNGVHFDARRDRGTRTAPRHRAENANAGASTASSDDLPAWTPSCKRQLEFECASETTFESKR
jgi:hypothetical protein